jgi:Ala-tRNA(Pro) deacylase
VITPILEEHSMAIAEKLKAHLEASSIDYELIPHPHSESSMVTAAAAHVPGDRLAKAVIVKDDDNYLMVVIASDYHVRLGALHQKLGREVGLATEPELATLFPDCDEGAAPPVGAAYGLKTLVDKRLLEQPDVYFESGDHEHLVKVSGAQFTALQRDAEPVDIAQHI